MGLTPFGEEINSTYITRTESSDDVNNFRLVYLPAPCLGEDLKCYLCQSNISWDECEKNKTVGVCYPDHDEVCITEHYIENDDTEKGYNEYFIKMCGQARLCTNKDCEGKSTNCQIHCCHSDLCNIATGGAHVTSTLLATVLAVVLQLCCII